MANYKVLSVVYYQGQAQAIGTIIKNPPIKLVQHWQKSNWVEPIIEEHPELFEGENVIDDTKVLDSDPNPSSNLDEEDPIPFPNKYKVIAENKVVLEETGEILEVGSIIDENTLCTKSINQMLNYRYIEKVSE